MSTNQNKINNKEITKKELQISNSPKEQTKEKNIDNLKEESSSEDFKTKINYNNEEINKISTNFSTEFQVFSQHKQFINNENDPTLDEKMKNIYENSFSKENIYFKDSLQKPTLSLKDSRTKIKQLRDQLSFFPEEEILKKQEELLPVPIEKSNDEKFKILKMHNLKRKSLPEYKSMQKFDDYKSFEDSFNEKNQYFILKKKKSVYSNTKFIKLKLNLTNENKNVAFPLFRDQDIGIYEYWQVPLIESKIDEDKDSDDEQINLAHKVCELDLNEGIKYLEKNGIKSLYNNKFLEKNEA